MDISVEHECPQCGGAVTLSEADHILGCPFCGVRSFINASGYRRFMLPVKEPGREYIFVPYLRFKGNVFFCDERRVGSRLVDITQLAVSGVKGLPFSLGLRPQAMKMRFFAGNSAGSFARITVDAKGLLQRAGRIPSSMKRGRVYHRVYIGETLSIIYLPLYVSDSRLYDGILERPLSDSGFEEESLHAVPLEKIQWKFNFLPTICPRCGWDLEGDSQSVVFACSNCLSFWELKKGRFERVDGYFASVDGGADLYLPFWRIEAFSEKGGLSSFGDFLRITNQPRVVKDSERQLDMAFWSPAFRISPSTFLRLSRQLTLTQGNYEKDERADNRDLYPVTLPQSEARQGLKLTLASSAQSKKKLFPLLPQFEFSSGRALLVYLPFKASGHDLIEPLHNLVINSRSIERERC